MAWEDREYPDDEINYLETSGGTTLETSDGFIIHFDDTGQIWVERSYPS